MNAHVFLSYSPATLDFVETLARRLHGDARLAFWFAPWHAIPGVPIQEQMEDALGQAQACAVFVSGSGRIEGWQNEQMRTAIQARVEDEPGYRVIPVLLPGVTPPNRHDLPRFLRRYEPVEFTRLDDEQAFQRLLAGILGIPPIQIAGYIAAERSKALLPAPNGGFAYGHALLIGVAHYPKVTPLPESVLNDARDLCALLTDPARCGYPPAQVVQLLDGQATGVAIRAALTELAAATGPDNTAVVFFSGHGAHDPAGGEHGQYLLPYDCDLGDLRGTAIAGDEMTALLRAIQAGRLLVFFDACHSGGAGDPKGTLPQFKGGLDEAYYQALAQGKGRVVMASSRPEEISWALAGMRNSLFTHFMLEALRGEAKTLDDGYVRVFDLFRHVADQVPLRAAQHPIFKATAMEEDFPVALCHR